MVNKRPLPKVGNPLLQLEQSPPFTELVRQRRLGQTEFDKLQPGGSGKHAPFDYAHLRVPLPRNLKGTDLFGNESPEFYFLMRRSSDGFISASGMFKAAFPWATTAEEETERKYIKGLGTTSPEETAGNVWVPPTHALQLAELYKISHWVRALLDPSPIEKVAGDAKKNIASPPQYLHLDDNSLFAPPAVTTTQTANRRGLRSGSPARATQPPKKAASSPRKRSASKQAAASAANASANANASNSSNKDNNKSDEAAPATAQQPQPAGSDDASPLAVAAGEHVKSKSATTVDEENIHVDVDSVVRTNGEVESTYTNVRIGLPPDVPGMPAPERPEDMVARAKEMVAEARKLVGSNGGAAASSGKRKFDELAADDDDDDDGDADDGDGDEEDDGEENEDDRGGEVSRYAGSKPVKRIRLLEEELQKERVRNRALVGLTFTFAFGALIPHLF